MALEHCGGGGDVLGRILHGALWDALRCCLWQFPCRLLQRCMRVSPRRSRQLSRLCYCLQRPQGLYWLYQLLVCVIAVLLLLLLEQQVGRRWS